MIRRRHGDAAGGVTYKPSAFMNRNMYTLGVSGPSDAGKTTLVENLVETLDGTVATVKHLTHPPDIDTAGKDTARHRTAGAAVTYGIAENRWFATGEQRTVAKTLDTLAATYDYAILEGHSDIAVPRVVLGDQPEPPAGEILLEAPTQEAVDLDTLTRQLHDTEEYVTLQTLVRTAKQAADTDQAGAIATFTGRVRRRDGPEDPPTEQLSFEKYEPVATQRLEALQAALEEREGVYRVLAHHRTGVIEAGEDIVFVVVLAGHRQEAFRTVEDGIDRLKEEVPIFKKEVTVEDEFWRHQQ